MSDNENNTVKYSIMAVFIILFVSVLAIVALLRFEETRLHGCQGRSNCVEIVHTY